MNTKKKIVPLNTTNDGLALALVSGYYKFGTKNLLDWKGTTGTCIMEIEKKDIEVLYKGHILHDGDGLYTDATDAFFRGGSKGISRTIKAESADAAVCLIEEMKEYKMIQKCGDRGTDNYSVSDNAYTITSNPMSDRGQMLFEQEEKEPKIKYIGRIRKLTEREAFRLMDVDDTDIDKIIAAGISKSQMYKLAGNSIVVSCLYHIFENLFCKEYDDEVRETLF